MNKELELMLNLMEGQNINIYICGKISNFQCFENFEWWIEPLLEGDQLVLSSQGEEKYFYISLESVQDIKICEELKEIRFIFGEDNLIQVWIDME